MLGTASTVQAVGTQAKVSTETRARSHGAAAIVTISCAAEKD